MDHKLVKPLFFRIFSGIALFAALLGSAKGQIFVTDIGTNTIGEYTTSGATVNASLISGLNQPGGIAILGSDIFVANTVVSGTIGEYTTSGATVSASLVSGLSKPRGIAISGSNLFVLNVGISSSTVGEYTTSGATVNASLISLLVNEQADGIAVSGSVIFLSDFTNQSANTNVVAEFTTSGAIGPPGFGALSQPAGLAIAGSNIFVANSSIGTIGEYNATTGATINATFISGLHSPQGIAISGSNLFVVNAANGTIGEYDATTGAVINASLISGLVAPVAIAVVAIPEPSTYAAVFGMFALGFVAYRRRRTV